MATLTISANGDYYLPMESLPAARLFEMGASMTGTGAGASVLLWGELRGVKTNLETAQAVTPAAPVVWPGSYSANPRRGVTVTGLEVGDVLTLEYT